MSCRLGIISKGTKGVNPTTSPLNLSSWEITTTILKGADADKSLIDGVAHFKCDSCESIAAPGNVSPVKAPSRYVFNKDVLLDLFDTRDDNRNVSVWLNIVCNGATRQAVCHAREGTVLPISRK